MLADHAFQLELLPNPDAGQLELYVLDGEAERFVRMYDAADKAPETVGVTVHVFE